MDYVFETLDLRDESDAARRRLHGWLRAMRMAFREARPDDEFEKLWLDCALADDQRVSGAWLPEGVFGASDVPVATFATFDKDINAGLEMLPARLITDVSASPAHRRRGLVRRLMEDALERTAAAGLPVVLLTASEATIYGRWGFGVATLRHRIELDTRAGLGWRHFTDPGRVEVVDPRTSWDLARRAFDRFHARTRGSVDLPAFYEPWLTGTHDFTSGEDRGLLAAVHLDADEQVDGIVVHKPEEQDGKAGIRVHHMFAADDTVRLALWQFLAGIDLATQVTQALAPTQDPLQWALTDFNRLRTTAVGELLWLRVLDVKRTFEARPWAADGQVVLEVTDPQAYASGRWTVTARQGRAQVEPTDAEPDVTVTAETLASLALGTVGVSVLRSAGRVEGRDPDVARFAAMADLSSEPSCVTAF